jgi:pyruvate dehydrogenase E2 component (dihydrolipoamide acetyltransferase)
VPTPVIMPKLEMTQETATVVEWLAREGERVTQGQPLLTIETDKVTVEVEAPATGILAQVQATPGQVVPVTAVIAQLLQPGEEAPGPGAPSHDAQSEDSRSPGQQPRPPASATPVARRQAAAAGIDLCALPPGAGPRGKVTKADVEAALAGQAAPGARVRATPAARRAARERGVNLEEVTGSGPRGRVQAADVPEQAASRASRLSEGAQVVPLAGMRLTIAERMTASYQTTPHIMLTMRVDMRACEKERAWLNARSEGGAHISVTAVIVKAVAWALRRHPWLNSTLREKEIHLLPEVNIGVAAALEEGLIVPVVHGADRHSLAETAAIIVDLTARAREGRLTPADVAGGTFTVSNLGVFGVEQFTAIINPPQAAILAVGAVQPEAVPKGRRVVVRPMMRMTLSADHRILDGAVAARFMGDLRDALEHPALLV